MPKFFLVLNAIAWMVSATSFAQPPPPPPAPVTLPPPVTVPPSPVIAGNRSNNDAINDQLRALAEQLDKQRRAVRGALAGAPAPQPIPPPSGSTGRRSSSSIFDAPLPGEVSTDSLRRRLQTLIEQSRTVNDPTVRQQIADEAVRLQDQIARQERRERDRDGDNFAQPPPPQPEQPQPQQQPPLPPFFPPPPVQQRGIDIDRDPLFNPPRQNPAPFDLPLPPIGPTPVGEKSPIDDDDNLLVDFGFGLKGEPADKMESMLKTRLEALAFAINSINTTTDRLLTVDDLMKQLYPGGRFRAGAVPTGKIDLTKFLSSTQIANFREALSKEPLNCATERPRLRNSRLRGRFDRTRLTQVDDDSQPGAEALRADVIVKAIMDQENYYQLLGLSPSRRGFERSVGIAPDFDVEGPNKDQSEDTMRLIIPPGKSGVAHPNAQRLVLLQKGDGGRLVIRTGDVDKNEATRDDRNFVLNPATATPTGSEEIWELPNGMRAYSARNGAGDLVTQVPHGLVMPNITNPRSCFSCHGADDKGFIAMGSAPKKKVKVVDQTVDGRTFGNRNLFKATWDEYEKAIEPANDRYAAALKRMGGSSRSVKALLDQYAGDVSVDKLAKEVGVEKDEVQATILSRRFRSSWDPTDEFDPKDADSVKNLSLTRAQLETGIDLGAGADRTRIRKPLYCAVKDLGKEQHAKATPTPREAATPTPAVTPTPSTRGRLSSPSSNGRGGIRGPNTHGPSPF